MLAIRYLNLHAPVGWNLHHPADCSVPHASSIAGTSKRRFRSNVAAPSPPTRSQMQPQPAGT